MERLTEEVQIGPFGTLKDKADAIPGAFSTYDCFYAHMVAVTRLKQYEDTIALERAQELAQAEKDGRLVVLEPAAKEGAEKPSCFYNDMGQTFCLGFARGEYDDEPIDRCKKCWYCQSTREEAEAALKKREADNETD